MTVQLECVDDALNQDCPFTGLQDTPNDFTYKTTIDTWVSWAGQDLACVDYSMDARGKWISDTEIDGGYNISLSGSLTNDC